MEGGRTYEDKVTPLEVHQETRNVPAEDLCDDVPIRRIHINQYFTYARRVERENEPDGLALGHLPQQHEADSDRGVEISAGR